MIIKYFVKQGLSTDANRGKKGTKLCRSGAIKREKVHEVNGHQFISKFSDSQPSVQSALIFYGSCI